MYIFKGKKLTKEQAEKIAAETDRDLTTFLNDNPEIEEDPDFGPQEESGKTSIIADQNAPAMIGSTALQLENGSLESKKTPADPIEEEYRDGTRKTVTVQGNEYSYEEVQKEYVGKGKGKFKSVEDYVKAFPKSYKASIRTQNKDYQTEAELNKTIGIQYDPNDGSEVSDPTSKGFIDSIKEVTVDSTREIILKDYFNLDQIPVIKSKSTGILPGQVEYINKPIPVKEYLGEEKYKQYLDQENIDIKDLPQDLVESTVNREKQRAAQLFINDNELSEIEQNKMLRFLPGDDSFKSDIAKNEVAYTKDALDFEAKFGRPLVRTETIQGRTYKFRGDSQTKDALKAIESQEKRVFEEIKLVTKDSETFIEEKIPNFEKQIIGLDSEITNLKEQIKTAKPTTQEELGVVNDQIVDLNSKVELRNNYVKNTVFDLELERQELNKRNNSIVNSFEDFGVTKIGNEAIQKNYELENRISLAIEQSFIGSGTMLGASALKGIADTVQFVDEAMFQREGASDFVSKETHNYLKNLKGGAINYNQALAKEKENQPDLLRYGDKGYWSRTLADQSGSILTTVATMGGVKLGLIGTKTAAKAIFGAFFTMEAGGEMANLETQQRNAPKILANLNLALESATNPYEIERIKKEISEQEDILNLSQFQKSFNSVAYGAIAAGAETLGSLGFIGNFQKYAKAIGYNSFRKVFNAGLSRTISKSVGAVAVGMPLSISINTLEETLTTLGQNLSDEAVLQQDKNFFEGIDSDFFRSTAVTSLALGGPAIGSNIYNAVSQEFSDRTEARKESKLRGELLNIQTQLDKGGLTRDARSLLEKSKKKALKELALDNTNKVLKISDLTADEFESITETNRELRNIQREAANIGASGDVSTWSDNELERLKTEYDNLLSNRQKVFDGKRQEVLDMFKGQTSNVVEAANAYGLYEFSKNVTRNQKGINQTVFNDKAEFAAYLKDNNYSDENQAKALEGYDNQSNAANPIGSNDIFVFKENIVKNIATKGRIGARIAAMSTLHELGHIQTRKAGIIKDGKVSGNAVKMIEGIKTKVKNLLDQGSIKKEEYDAFEKRINQYKDSNGEIDADELIQAVADFTNMGVLPKSAFNSVFEIKTYVNSVMKYINGDASMYFQLDTADDVFNFVSSWTTKATQGIQLGTEEDEEKTGKLNLSEKADLEVSADNLIRSSINEENTAIVLNPESTPAQIDKAKTALVENNQGIINNVINKNFKQGLDTDLTREEFAADIGLEVQKLINTYGKNKKTGEKAPFGVYLRNNLPLRVPAIFDKQLQTVDGNIVGKVDISKADQAIDESSEIDLDKKKEKPVKPKESLRESIPISDAVVQKVRDAVVKTFGTRLPSVESKDFKEELRKAFRTELKTTIAKDVLGTRDSYETFLRDNFEAIYEAIPQEVINKRFKAFKEPVLKKDGKQLRENTAQGNAVFEKKKISKAEFIKNFLGRDVGTSTKGTRKDALAETLAEEFAFDATPETIQTESVADKRESLFKDQSTEGVVKAIGRPIDLKFSKAFPEITKLELDLAIELTEFIEKSDIDTFYDGNGSILPEHKKYSNVADIVYELFNDPGGLDTSEGKKFKKSVKDSKDIPSDIKDRFLDQGTFRYNKEAKDVLASDVKIISKALGSDIMDILGYDVFGFYNRALDPASRKINPKWKKGDSISEKYLQGVSGEYFEVLQDIKKAVSGSKSKVQSKVLKDVRKMNKSFPLFKKVDKIFKLDTSREAKIKELEKLKLEIEAANKANIELANFIVKDVNKLYRDGKIDGVTVLNILQLQTNATGGLRALSTLDFVTFEDGPQLYNTKGEHLAPNANTMFELAEIILDKKLNTEDSNSLIEGAFAEHSQWYTSNELTDIVDKRGGKNNRSNSGRIKFLDNKDIVNVFNIDGSSYRSGEITKEFENKIAPSILKASKSNNNKSAFKYSKAPTNKVTIDTAAKTDEALNVARDLNAPVKKIRVFDFDDTLAQTKSDVLYTMPDGKEGKLNAEQFANDGSTLLSEGAVFDFSEFNKVTEGKKGPLFKVAQTIAAKRGTEDVFVLTARAPESQLAIYEFLKSQGLDIPLKNITGLGDSTGDAKARWIVDKAADGYNDFYFADDAPQNVKAVKDALSVIDVKSKTQQAKIKFSKSLDLDKDFNDIIENKTGIGSDKTYSRVKAQVAGASKGKFNFFIPPSAEDFVGLLYSTLGKGDVGDAQMAWYKSHLLNPFARAMENLANDRANIMQDFRGLKKSLGIVPKNLRKKIKDSNFTKEQAVRAYIWDKQGMEIPGISQKDQKDLVDFVNADAELVVFGDQLIEIGKGDAYAAPDAGWVAGNIGTDFMKALNTTKRSKYLETWQQNVDQIFSEANLNKLEAAYGANYREAMVDMLKRMKTGKNTSSGSDRLAARFTDWLTNSVGAIMFFNTRSAVLQTISAVNFINFSDNNVLKAGAAFANQPQYWSDFKKLFNSPFLLDRRSGLKLNVNEADIAAMAKGPGNSARNVIAGILKAGFLPTQIADSFAIASGGASFYRNRIKALQKEGLTEAEAEEQAFRDFREIAEESQQSSRPDKISQQQAGPLGRVVLAFANTPAQYARLIKKAASDLKNGRGDAKTNISKIIYYGVAQNLLFSALQQALFAIAFDDEEEEEKKNEKYFNIVNGMSDSILRGIGIGGAIVSVVKNTALKLAKEADKKSPKYQDAVVKGILQISPPISSKVGKLQSAGRSYSWNQEEMRTRGWSIDNPAYLANANVISALTNVPLDRAVKKVTNIVDAGNEDIEYYKRVALALGWSAWELGIDKKGGKVAPPKTNMDKLYDLNKKEQIDSLLSLGLSKKQIKLLKKEEDRVKAILDPKSIKKIKVSKRDSLFGLNKKDQIQALERLGLNKKEIKALRLESDRVEAIINKQKQEN